LVALALLLWLGTAGTAGALPADVAAALTRGIDRLVNLQPDQAAAEAQAIQQQPGGEAAGAFLAAFVPLAHLAEKEDTAADLDQFLEALKPILEQVQAQETARPRDPEVKLLAGMVWGAKAMADGGRRNVIAAYRGIKEAHRGFSEALALQPDLYDAYYGLGLYEISLGQLPRLLRSAATVVLPPGNLARGLERLRLAADRGAFTRPLAQMALFTYLVGTQRYAEAAPLGQALLDRYPNNPDLYFPLALCYSETGRHEDALRVARRVGARLDTGAPPFRREMLPRYYQLMGKVYMDMGEHAAALRFFQRAIDHGNRPYAWVIAWAWTRSGMIYDQSGDRAEATRRYRKALEVETESLAKEVAQEYLAVPYTGNAPRPRRQ
jgi:tetratricopeptide (TPR) repeat protein